MSDSNFLTKMCKLFESPYPSSCLTCLFAKLKYYVEIYLTFMKATKIYI